MSDPRDTFIRAAVWHGPLDDADGILVAHPELATADIHTAAILGDVAAVRRFLESDRALAVSKSPPLGWDALTHLCFSKYLRLDAARSDGFVAAATALLDAGADPGTGFHESGHEPEPAFEPALYGAAGVAHHAGLTRLLIARGADVNDEEVAYHSPETYDNGALEVLIASGRLTADCLAIMLVRKADWHDLEGVRLLLAAGADPKRTNRWGNTALHHAVRRDNDVAIIEAMLDHGADITIPSRRGPDSGTAAAIAARRGRADLLDLFERRGLASGLEGADRLLAACARADDAAIRAIARSSPELVNELRDRAGAVLAGFAGAGNHRGIRRLLDLGSDLSAPHSLEDGYWGLAPGSTALHVAAWRLRHETVRLLVERGADVNARDAAGRTPLELAVKACVDSYWKELRAPASVEALLAGGASADGVEPCGYAPVDALLQRTR